MNKRPTIVAEKPLVIDGVVLTRTMAAALIAHANGPRLTRADERDRQTLRALRARRLVAFNRHTRPTQTTATVRGREIIALLLAMQADALATSDSTLGI